MELDSLDRKILSFLQEDGRINFVTIASKLGVSEGTIRKRIRKLEKNEIFKPIGITNPFKVGLDTVAFLWMKTKRGYLETVIESLNSIESIRYLVVTTGSYDLVCMVVLPNRESLIDLLNQQLPRISGIESTETSIVLKIHKQINTWANKESS